MAFHSLQKVYCSLYLWSLIISPLHQWRTSKLNILQHLKTVKNYRNTTVFDKVGQFRRKTFLAQISKYHFGSPKNLIGRFERRRQERNQWPRRHSDLAAIFTDHSVFLALVVSRYQPFEYYFWCCMVCTPPWRLSKVCYSSLSHMLLRFQSVYRHICFLPSISESSKITVYTINQKISPKPPRQRHI